MNLSDIHANPAQLLQDLIRFDTTNPPGNETECVSYIDALLQDAGFKTTILASNPNRPNLIARLKGQGTAPPLLMHGHVDVVTTENQKWQHLPFAGELIDNYIWGRGALDMKGCVTMMLGALLRSKHSGLVPAGDVVIAILSDEEAGSDLGARFLVENHSDLFEGVRYAIGEFGGFSTHIAGKKFYPIMVAEKQMFWMKATIRGQGGHGSRPITNGTMARLGEVLRRLTRGCLPAHITPATKMMIQALATAMPFPTRQLVRQMLNPNLSDLVLKLMGGKGQMLNPLLHNTVSPTILHGSEKINVIPSEVSMHLDGRILPGFGPDDFLKELHQLIGDDIEIEVLRHDPVPDEPDMGLFEILADILRESDPTGVPMPLLLSASTDARFFAQLGIQTYGFTPMNLPPKFEFWKHIHAADERIPVDTLTFGVEAIYKLLQRFGSRS